MRVAFIIVGLIFVLGLSGCMSAPNGQRPVSLTRQEFVGHSLSLVSDTQVEQYNFAENGVVMASLGSKDLVTGPVLKWEIVSGDTLRMTDLPQVSISYQFRSLTEHDAVTMDGKRFRRD